MAGDPDKPCPHERTAATVTVYNLTQDEGGPVTSYYADVRINCGDCDEPFRFIGPNIGISPTQPMVSFDGTELRAPIRPASAPQGWGEGGPAVGFNVVAP